MLLKAEYESIHVINTTELLVLMEIYDMHELKFFTFLIYYNIARYASTFIAVIRGISGSNTDIL